VTWWVLPWLLFLACLAAVGGSYLLWRRRHPVAGAATPPVDVEDYR